MTDYKFCPRCAAPLISRDSLNTGKDQIEIKTPLVCSTACGFIYYNNPVPIVAVVVEYNGDVLLAHNRAWEKPFYGVITGFVDHGEAPDECAIREVKEELNLNTDAATLIGVYPSKPMNQVIIGYHVNAYGDIVLNEELDDFKLVPLEKCFAPNVGTGFILRDWLLSRGIEPTMLTITTQDS